jgi:hypothetical protein
MAKKGRDASKAPDFILFVNRYSEDPPEPSFPRTRENSKTWGNLLYLLDDIVKKRELRESKMLTYFLQLAGSQQWGFEKGKIAKLIEGEPVFIARSVVNFLSDEENIRRLRKCPECLDYFVASTKQIAKQLRDDDIFVFCSTECKNAFYNPLNKKKRALHKWKKRQVTKKKTA